MATSRYDTPATTAAGVKAAGSTVSGNSSTTGNSTTQGESTTNGSSTTNSSGTSTTNTQNMTGTSLAALEALIQTLMNGGTPTQQMQSVQRQAEIQSLQGQRGDYSKEAAFADAQGLVSQTMRRTLEQLLPGINRASAGAGTSQGSMRALLLNRSAEVAAENAAAQGLQASVNYGNVANGVNSNITSLINGQQDTVTQALLAALQVARGAVTNSTTNTTGTSTTDSTQNTQSNSNTQTSQNTNQNQTTGTGSGSTTSGNTSRLGQQQDELVYYGPTQASPSGAGTGSSLDTILQLAGQGGSSGWSNNFTF